MSSCVCLSNINPFVLSFMPPVVPSRHKVVERQGAKGKLDLVIVPLLTSQKPPKQGQHAALMISGFKHTLLCPPIP